MKATCITLLSLLLMLVQVAFASPTRSPAAAAGTVIQSSKHACCEVRQANCCACCVDSSRPGAGQLPAVPAPSSGQSLSLSQLSAVLTVLWSLPAVPAHPATAAFDSASEAPPAVPLFLRHGALLI